MKVIRGASLGSEEEIGRTPACSRKGRQSRHTTCRDRLCTQLSLRMQTLLNLVLGEMSDDLRTNCKACRRRIKKPELTAVRDAMKTSK